MILLLGFFSQAAIAGDPNTDLATTARNMIGKTDANSKKLNTLKAPDAVKYCAKKAAVITQAQSDKLKALDMINIHDQPAVNLTQIPKGNLIGFFDASTKRMVHCMISTGNGKAVGVDNKLGTGIGVDNKWAEITLQGIKLDKATGSFKRGTKTILIRYKDAKLINTPTKESHYQELPYVRETKANAAELAKYKWAKGFDTDPMGEFKKHGGAFKEFKTWQQYANGANLKLKGAIAKGKNLPQGLFFQEANGNLFYFEQSSGTFIVANKTKQVVTMHKPKEGKQFYDAWITGGKMPHPNFDGIPGTRAQGSSNEYQRAPENLGDIESYDPAPENLELQSYDNAPEIGELQSYDSPPSALTDDGTYVPIPYAQIPKGDYESIPELVSPPEYAPIPEHQMKESFEDVEPTKALTYVLNYAPHKKWSYKQWGADRAVHKLPLLKREFAKHKRGIKRVDFKGTMTMEEYSSAALNFRDQHPKGTKAKKSTSGEFWVLYNKHLNLLGVYDTKGRPITFQRPAGKHRVQEMWLKR